VIFSDKAALALKQFQEKYDISIAAAVRLLAIESLETRGFPVIEEIRTEELSGQETVAVAV
jgi:hypothetical protein